jgi:hypothetical protein
MQTSGISGLELIESCHNQNPDMRYGQRQSAVPEAQRYQAHSTPSRPADRFYMNELTKANHNLTESSEGYHEWALKSGRQQAANPFDFRRTLVRSLEKAGNPWDFKQQSFGLQRD